MLAKLPDLWPSNCPVYLYCLHTRRINDECVARTCRESYPAYRERQLEILIFCYDVGMELKEFIKTTLRELSEAIDESGVSLKKKIALTNTTLRVKSHGNYGLIDFDLAVEVHESSKIGGSGGLRISVVEAKLGKNSEAASSSTSRIKFTVEVDFDSFQAQVDAQAKS